VSRVLYFDCFSGISGDMTLGALIDAGLPLADLTRALGSLTLLTQPSSLNLTFDGLTVATPHVVESVVGTTHTIGAPSSQRLGKNNYRFLSWSDGGAQTHTITTPTVDTTYTAVYQRKGHP
jgi:hypothetical protein